MTRSASSTKESHLSRGDIELLAKIGGGMEALIAQVNTLQLSAEAGREAQRAQSEMQRTEHNEQMKVLTVKIESLELWKVTTITPERVMNWDLAADRVGDYLNDKAIARQEKVNTRVEGWAYLLGLGSVALTFIVGLVYWLLDNVILPFFGRKGGM